MADQMQEPNENAAVDRGLLRRLDWANSDLAQAATSDTAVAPPLVSNASIDISAIVEAVQLTASSMSAMAGRVRELEAHAEAFAASNEEIEAQNRQMTIELGEVVQSRDALAASLAAERERSSRLEGDTAQQIAKAHSIERDLAVAREDLSKIVEAIGGGTPAPRLLWATGRAPTPAGRRHSVHTPPSNRPRLALSFRLGDQATADAALQLDLERVFLHRLGPRLRPEICHDVGAADRQRD